MSKNEGESPLLNSKAPDANEEDSVLSSSHSKIGVLALLTNMYRSNKTSLYVLFICSIVYMINQVDRYLIAVTSKQIQQAQHWGNRNGGGIEYDFLVGPVFTMVYLPAGIPMSILADRYPLYRHYILGVLLVIWSLSILWSGFSQTYTEIAVSRFILAFCESGCTPLAVSIITDFFSKKARATALGIYNWGIYLGFSLALGIGNALTSLAGWRIVWWIFGGIGIIFSLFVFTLPIKSSKKEKSKTNSNKCLTNLKVLFYFLKSPSIILILLGSLIRNAGGYVWAFNTKIFFEQIKNQSELQQATFMSWIPLICGSLGSVFGGYISDKYVKNASSFRRLIILILSNLLASPFAFMALILPQSTYPAFYLSLIPSNIIGEMWIGVTLTIIVELIPNNMKTTGLSIYFFIIGLAGFVPQLVTPFKNVFHSYLWSMVLLFPGLYVISALIFLMAFLFVGKDKKKANLLEEEEEEPKEGEKHQLQIDV